MKSFLDRLNSFSHESFSLYACFVFVSDFVLPLCSFQAKKLEILSMVSGIFLLLYYILLTNPVSFGEGDRLVLTTLPLWAIFYPCVIEFYRKTVSQSEK